MKERKEDWSSGEVAVFTILYVAFVMIMVIIIIIIKCGGLIGSID